MSLKLSFHGAARTVTGSRYLITHDDGRTVIDAGLFQGYKELRELNWRTPPFDAASINQILLTHAHIDHIGFLPRMVKNGFNGAVYATAATIDIARLSLLDSAKIQEEDARYANKKGYSSHRPALPLYSVADAQAALKLLKPVDFNQWVKLDKNLQARWQPSGHILGSASIEVVYTSPQKKICRIVFSGDIGRYNMPLHIDPDPLTECDVLICESTYGNRDHDHELSVQDQLCEAIGPTLKRKGTILIPAFAIGRSQQLILILQKLFKTKRIPTVPIHLDSPMAINATDIYSDHMNDLHLDENVFEDGRDELFPENITYHRHTTESIALNSLPGPRIIISASGMLNGGRVLHHLKRLITKRKNHIVLVGYQAPGTRGRNLLEGQHLIKIHGKKYKVKAKISSIYGLSAHGDRGEILRWMSAVKKAPKIVFLTHGESDSAFAFADKIKRQLGWKVEVPYLDYTAKLDKYLR